MASFNTPSPLQDPVQAARSGVLRFFLPEWPAWLVGAVAGIVAISVLSTSCWPLAGTLSFECIADQLCAVGLIGCVLFLLIQRRRERAGAAHALADAEYRWKYALEGAGDGVWDWNVATGEVFYSPQWCRMLGYAPDEVTTPAQWRALLHPDDAERVVRALDDYAHGRSPAYAVEYRLLCKNQQWKWVFSRGAAVASPAAHGGARIIGTHADIDARKRAEEQLRQAELQQAAFALQQSELRFRQLADAMPQMVWTADANGGVDYGNQVVDAYLGLGPLDPRTANWTAAVHPDDLDRVLGEWSDAVRLGRRYDIDFRVRHAQDGAYRWHHTQCVPIRDDSGAVIKWYGTATDNHDERLAHEKVRNIAHRLTTILESITEAFFTLDADWKFTYINGETERLLARARETLLGQVIWDVFPELCGSIVEQQYRHAVGSRAVVKFLFFYASEQRWFAIRAYPSGDGLTVYLRDTTERHRSQLVKRQQADVLERIAAGCELPDVIRAVTELVRSADTASLPMVMAPDLGLNSGQRFAEESALALAIRALPAGAWSADGAEVRSIDFASDPGWQSARQPAADAGIRSGWTVTIRSSAGKSLGSLIMLSPKAGAPGHFERQLLESSAHILSIALEKELNGYAARANAESLRLRQRAIDASANPIVIRRAHAPDFPVEYVNPAFESVTGYPAAQVLGRSLVMLHDDDCQAAIAELQQARIAQREGRAVVRLRHRDGTSLWLDNYSAPVADELGNVTHFVHTMYDITDARQYLAELEFKSNFDTLTGLGNQNLLRDRLAHALARAERSSTPLWLACLNIDRFRLVNSSLGHEAGNVVLKTAAARITQELGTIDTAARWGSDEFVVVLASAEDEHAATATVRRILQRLGEPIHLNGMERFLTGTAGLAMYPADGDDPAGLIKHAHMAMHLAKDSARGDLQFFTPAMNSRAQDRLLIETDLRHALQRGEFFLEYQPQVELRTGQVIGVEALLRWRHPHQGLMGPDRFLHVAEETGLIVAIGTWVLQTACRDAKRWQNAGHGQLRVGVNLSGAQFHQHDLVQTVAAALAEAGLEAERLDIELTEGIVMDDIEQSLAVMQQLKELGVHLSLDDFGTGYSSLSYLKRFPIDILKIDKSFIRNLITDPEEAAIARSVINLARSLELQVIAEGVETEAQLSYLRRHGCDQVQGFFFSRPLPAHDLEALLAADKRLDFGADSGAQERTLLIVDDDPNVLSALYRLLRRDGYRILRALDAAEGLELLALNDVQVIIADQRMPGLTGVEFFTRVKGLHPNVIRIMLSGYTAVDSIIEATNLGSLFRFHTKPWDDAALRESVSEAFRYHWLMHGAEAAMAGAAPAV